MRTALKMIGSEEKHVFYGTFERYGIKNGYKGPLNTVLLVDIKDKNRKIITTHLWFNLTKGFEKLEMKRDDLVSFKGRIKPYIKGYMGKRDDVLIPIEMDYLIEYPTQVQIVNQEKQLIEGDNNNGRNC